MSKHKPLLQKGINYESTRIEPENFCKGNPSAAAMSRVLYLPSVIIKSI